MCSRKSELVHKEQKYQNREERREGTYDRPQKKSFKRRKIMNPFEIELILKPRACELLLGGPPGEKEVKSR